MKILLVNTRHYWGGGDSTYVFNLAQLLRKEGHDVAFFAMQDTRNLPDPNSDLFVSHIDFRELNQKKDPITGFQVLTRSIYSFEARRKFGLLLDRENPDMIHLQSFHAHITPSIIFEAKKRHIPIVWTVHSYRLVCPNEHFLIDESETICEACGKGRFYRAVQKKCKKGSVLASTMAALEAYVHQGLGVKKNIDVFLAPSNFMKNKLIQYGSLDETKIKHVPLFIPDTHFQLSSENEDYFLFFGRLEKIKGIFPLLEAAKRLDAIKIKIAGPVDPIFLKKISPLFSDNIEYVGMKQGEELKKLICGCQAVLFPSLTYENQPFSILEAFGMGKPVIASCLGGMQELITHMERGLLISPGAVDELVEAIRFINNNPALAKDMGINAYHYALENHSPEKHYRDLLKIYQDLVN